MQENGPADLQTLSDLCTPWCVHVVATLRIAEHIAAGKSRIDDLAKTVNCDPYALHRVMTHLVGKGVFEEPNPGRFALNGCAQGLLDPMARIGLDLNGIGGRMAHGWGTLLTYVRTGTADGYRQRFGLPFWADLAAHPEIAASFDDLIGATGHGTPNPDFEITGGWDSIRHIVDVGGGTGGMLAQVLLRHPHARGTLVELPRTIALSHETFRAAGLSNRVTTVAQSFFDPLPAGADVYLLRGIINDWADAEATAILRGCADAARRSGGRVVLLKGISNEGAPRGLMIEMVLCGGKLRTVRELTALARDAGLQVVAAAEQPSGYFVVECRA